MITVKDELVIAQFLFATFPNIYFDVMSKYYELGKYLQYCMVQ